MLSIMKSDVLKTSLIISFAVGVLVIGAIILVRQKPASLQPKLHAEHYPHGRERVSESRINLNISVRSTDEHTR